jgi:DNA ligase (NAD+)
MSFEKRKFCITGALYERTRNDYIHFIESNGGLYSSSVTNTTDYLVTNEDTMTTKRKKAIEKGIPIISEEKFLHLIKKNKKLNEIAEAMGW